MNNASIRVQISAGGVAFRKLSNKTKIAIISVGDDRRWQLPKGTVERGESTESAAIREVREEAGIETEIIKLIDKIEYWYYSKDHDKQVRYHKFVYFFLLRYKSGNIKNHDTEAHEVRWIEINKAIEMLAFENEKKIVRYAKEMMGEKNT
ncbi:MAG: MutT/nudix family protein [Candidatus Jettenia ecosi]|uniref:MutT/nudix family protein n=1 Tax=Candidatus Jettenia ecosi TaxID=2494326 RepID=A0A533Q6I6_9BACT|nr:MAG: MutT/nudix family protein [Candidatus Jettenia ecosi]